MSKKKVATKKQQEVATEKQQSTLEKAEISLMSAITGDPRVIELSGQLDEIQEQEHALWREENGYENQSS